MMTATATATATAELTGRVHALAAECPPAALDHAARCVLDHLGCALAGHGLSYARPHFAAMAALGTDPEATCADGVRRPAFVAAYLNAASANALDYDDTLQGHPGAPIIAAALAAAERAGADVGTLLTAVVAGYEAHWLLSRAGAPSPERAAHVRGVAAWDAMSAGVAAAVAGGADRDRLDRVVGLAATQSLVPFVGQWYRRPMPTVKNNHGWVAAAGLLAADLERAGAGGLTAPLDGPEGFWAMAGSDRWDWAGVDADGGPAILRAGFKRYPACWRLQQYLTVADALLRDGAGREPTHIEVSGPAGLRKFAEPHVRGPADVAFSLPTLVALLVLGVEPGPAWVADRAVAGTRAVLGRVEVRLAHERAVAVTFADGHRVVAVVPEDDYARPRDWGLDEEEAEAKFARLAAPVVGAAAAEGLRAALLDPEPGRPVRSVTEHLWR
ncbi:MmgE/PrpD family protein [Jiangella mangrovi]|uniref:2-methylcitrate dehydratase PrpD n=1 Tax=Jiangella mangrovi TaxID=1524084 RepID=A0A7W9LLX1_9ACTN|nr:MmgE/PrpD family protein [Jiangella mangrovi]MBB5788579.1 2-methylcitrate dehydratase PrpD [Jiangella mangrovi]